MSKKEWEASLDQGQAPRTRNRSASATRSLAKGDTWPQGKAINPPSNRLEDQLT